MKRVQAWEVHNRKRVNDVERNQMDNQFRPMSKRYRRFPGDDPPQPLASEIPHFFAKRLRGGKRRADFTDIKLVFSTAGAGKKSRRSGVLDHVRTSPAPGNADQKDAAGFKAIDRPNLNSANARVDPVANAAGQPQDLRFGVPEGQTVDRSRAARRPPILISLLRDPVHQVTARGVCEGGNIGEELLRVTIGASGKFFFILDGPVFLDLVCEEPFNVSLSDGVEIVGEHVSVLHGGRFCRYPRKSRGGSEGGSSEILVGLERWLARTVLLAETQARGVKPPDRPHFRLAALNCPPNSRWSWSDNGLEPEIVPTNAPAAQESTKMPPQLFKYCSSEDGLKVLNGVALKATPPNEFNDPFEFRPVVQNKDPKGDALRVANETINNSRFVKEHKHLFPECQTFEEFQGLARAKRDLLISTWESETSRLDGILRNEIGALSGRYGVICFSSQPSLLLMWAHYAAAHTGFVLEFDTTNPIFKSHLFFKVEYLQARAEYDTSSPPNRSTILDLAIRKSPEWEYEQEYRLIVDLRQTTRRPAKGKTLHLLPVFPGLFKSVTFGLRVDTQSRDAVLSLAKRPSWQHLEVFQVEADSKEFMLRRRKLE